MFCPNCKAEYRKGYTHCPECDCALVTELPPSPASPARTPNPNEKPKLLCEAADEFEADLITQKLKCYGIYAYKHLKGTDGYNKILLGRTVLGIQIFVGESDFQDAKEILMDSGEIF